MSITQQQQQSSEARSIKASFQARLAGWLPPMVVFAIGIGLWEALVRVLNIGVFLLPAPSTIVMRLVEDFGLLLTNASYTFQSALFGFLIGCTLGVLVAMLAVRWTWIADALLPFAIASNAVPIIALAPLVGIWLGSTSQSSKIAIVAMMTFFPTLISTFRGLMSPEPAALELMHSYAANAVQTFVKVRIPASLPYLFNALKLSATLSMIGALVSEYFGGPLRALGVYILQQASVGRYTQAWAGILVACLFGIAFYLVIIVAERLMMPWHIEQRTK
jgi:NitT/TauT family transport system permease protein